LKFRTFVTLWVDEISVPIEDGRNGTFMIGNESFPASLLDLPAVVESYKTYDDSVLIKTADIGQVKVHVSLYVTYLLNFISNHLLKNKLKQMIMVREENDPPPEGVEYKHGLTPPMRDARRRRFRREPDLNVLK
jgi:transcription initiation factor TFIID subunit 7